MMRKSSPTQNVRLAKSQANHTYLPALRLRKDALNTLETRKLSVGLSCDPSIGWQLTSNPKVRAISRKEAPEYRIIINRRNKTDDRVGKRVYSHGFETITDAENMLFEFRLSHESA